MHKGLLFDLDGVLVDTAKYHYLAWKEIADGLGISFSRQDNELLKGVSRSDSFAIILRLGAREMPEEEQARYCQTKNDRYLEFIRAMPAEELLPGVREFITAAKAAPGRCPVWRGWRRPDKIFRRYGRPPQAKCRSRCRQF